jgi:hypothetical protein
MREMKNTYRILVHKLERKRPIGRPSHTWKTNINMDLKEVGCENVDWIHLVQYRDQWMGSFEHCN